MNRGSFEDYGMVLYARATEPVELATFLEDLTPAVGFWYWLVTYHHNHEECIELIVLDSEIVVYFNVGYFLDIDMGLL